MVRCTAPPAPNSHSRPEKFGFPAPKGRSGGRARSTLPPPASTLKSQASARYFLDAARGECCGTERAQSVAEPGKAGNSFGTEETGPQLRRVWEKLPRGLTAAIASNITGQPLQILQSIYLCGPHGLTPFISARSVAMRLLSFLRFFGHRRPRTQAQGRGRKHTRRPSLEALERR